MKSIAGPLTQEMFSKFTQKKLVKKVNIQK